MPAGAYTSSSARAGSAASPNPAARDTAAHLSGDPRAQAARRLTCGPPRGRVFCLASRLQPGSRSIAELVCTAQWVRRWRQRWLRPARALAQILAATGQAAWATLATRLPVDATCADLDLAFTREHDGPPLAGLAALLYRLQPNVRLL